MLLGQRRRYWCYQPDCDLWRAVVLVGEKIVVDKVKSMYNFNRQVLAHKTIRPLTGGLSPGKTGMCQHQKATTARGFVVSGLGLCSIRGGTILKNPDTRASQSGEGGLSLEPGGFTSLDKRGDGMAPKTRSEPFSIR